jgi:hypothetical protein
MYSKQVNFVMYLVTSSVSRQLTKEAGEQRVGLDPDVSVPWKGAATVVIKAKAEQCREKE